MATHPSPSPGLPPVQHGYQGVGSLNLHYAEIPTDGRPMVMLHGIGMDWRVWQAISRRLAPYFHLYLVDLRGHGASDKPPHGYDLPSYAADIEDFIDGLSLDDAVLVGSSLGGMVAASTEIPADVVSHRILVDPPMTGGPIRDPAMFQDILRLKHQPVPELADYLAISNPGTGRFLLTMMSEMWHEAADGVIEDMLARPIDYFAIDQALRANEAPTLLMQADPTRGASLKDEGARAALRLLPRGSLVTIPGAGHAIHATSPADFVRQLIDFVGVNG